MIALIVRRLLQLPIIVGVIYTITLVLAWAVPGNPLENPEGRRPEDAVVAMMKAQYNLDSFPRFYVSYLDSATGAKWLRETLGGVAAHDAAKAEASGLPPPDRPVFDLGPSLKHRDQRVNSILAAALPVSVTLGLMAIILAAVIGVLAGVVGAVKPNSPADLSTLAVALIGISLPSFVIGTVLLLVFGVWLRLLPPGGWGTLGHMVLPALTLSLPFAAYIARLTRMGMIEHLGADYIRTARAKGLAERDILLKHALKNAFLPVLSYLGPATALAMTGSFVVERVFNVPGLGQHFVNAVQNKDLFLIIGVVLVFSTMLVLLNLAVDVLYRWADPRID
ncbi:MAG TPA: ABC transporter permease [Phycisphaerales bacterium]|nr:ABC transporter permease [Phycisphaerales bacterium]